MNGQIEDLTAELAAMQTERDAALLERDKAEADREHIREWGSRMQDEMEHQARLAMDARAEAASNAALLKLVRQDLADYHKLDDDRISIAMIRIDKALAAIASGHELR